MMKLDRVTAGYEGAAKLMEVSACFAPGEMLGIIGPNGCGKSTLIKLAAGIIRPMKGSASLDGANVHQMKPRELARRVAYMPQSRAVSALSVRQLAEHGRYPHLGFGRQLGPQDRASVERALQITDAVSYAHRPVNRLSGGERQRAYLSMLLAQDCPFMLLDEPAAALDIGHQFELMDLLAKLRDSGKALAVVLHDLGQAMRYCDRLLLLRGGRALFDGSPEALYQSGLIETTFGVTVRRIDHKQYLFGGGKVSAGDERTGSD